MPNTTPRPSPRARHDSAGRRILEYKNSDGVRTRSFFNGLTEEIKKVSVGTGADTSFARITQGSWVRLERDLQADLTAGFGKTLSCVTGIYLWSGGTSSPYLYIDDLSFSNSLTVEHNTLGGGSIGQILRHTETNPSTYAQTNRWFHYDQVGSVMAESDSSGGLAQTHYQDAFGNTQVSWSTGLWGGDKEGWHHNTKEYDGSIGYVYMDQRWYSPESGTFSSSAPYSPMRENRYGFARSHPGTAIDPTGREVEVCCRTVNAGGTGGQTASILGMKHCWLSAGSVGSAPGIVAGMGPDGGSDEPLPANPFGTPTRINDHSKECGDCKPLPGCNESCVAARLRGDITKPSGSWGPSNNCNTYVEDVLRDCGCTMPGDVIDNPAGDVLYKFVPDAGYGDLPIPRPTF